MPKGGPREGAGRPKGAQTRRDPETNVSLAELARAHTGAALRALAEIATKGRSEAARVSAAIALLDRGHGRPAAPGEGASFVVIERSYAAREPAGSPVAGERPQHHARTFDAGTAPVAPPEEPVGPEEPVAPIPAQDNPDPWPQPRSSLTALEKHIAGHPQLNRYLRGRDT